MTIAVCLKTVVDPGERVGVEALRDSAEGLGKVVNPADRAGLEAALRLRDAWPEVRVVGLSVAPESDLAVLRWALSQGADELRLIWDPACAEADAMTVAAHLAAAARGLGAALIVCGARALDGNGGGLGAAIAELLIVPALTAVARLWVEEGPEKPVLRAERRLGGGLRAEVECELPAVVAVEEGAMAARYPRLRDRLRGEKAAVAVVPPGEAGDADPRPERSPPRVAVRSLSRPRPTTAGIFVPDRTLSPEDQLAQLMGGGQTAPGAGGADSSDVEEAVRFLAKGRFLE